MVLWPSVADLEVAPDVKFFEYTLGCVPAHLPCQGPDCRHCSLLLDSAEQIPKLLSAQ